MLQHKPLQTLHIITAPSLPRSDLHPWWGGGHHLWRLGHSEVQVKGGPDHEVRAGSHLRSDRGWMLLLHRL